ncbi:MAG: hypothetical protein E7166_05045 [Firmicutes bacterium]|nr:hypothetical protein [Bacillota bacterium]
MKVRNIVYTLILILSCFFVFDMDVNAEDCKLENKCCAYSKDNGNYYVEVKFDYSKSRYQGSAEGLKYGGKDASFYREHQNRPVKIQTGDNSTDYISLSNFFAETVGVKVCPEFVILFKVTDGQKYVDIYSGYDEDDVKKTAQNLVDSEYYHSFQIIPLADGFKKTNANIMAAVDSSIDELDEAKKKLISDGCDKVTKPEETINDCKTYIEPTVNNYIDTGTSLLKSLQEMKISNDKTEKLKTLRDDVKTIVDNYRQHDNELQTQEGTNYVQSGDHYFDTEIKNTLPPGAIGVVGLATGNPMTCESLKNTETYKIVRSVFTWIQIAAPIMLVIFGVVDFTKAVAASDNDAIKKAQGAFVKRVIIAAIIILLPFIVDLLLSLLDGALGNNVSTCDIGR